MCVCNYTLLLRLSTCIKRICYVIVRCDLRIRTTMAISYDIGIAYAAFTRRWSLDPRVRHTVWGLAIGLGCAWSASTSVNQAAVQRYSATKSIFHARL